MDWKATGVRNIRTAQVMKELCNEDLASFTSFLRMPLDMFDELLDRVGPRITKMHARYREPVESGLKLSITIRHLASLHERLESSTQHYFTTGERNM